MFSFPQMERLKDVQRRAETDLRKELCLARKAEEEAKRLNEEFKKKVSELYAVTHNKSILFRNKGSRFMLVN